MRKSGYMDFFSFFKKIHENFSFWQKKVNFLHLTALIMLLTCSGDLNESFEYLFIVLAQLEQEIWSKCHARSNFIEKSEKKHKSLGRDLKKIFLPNKKYFSLVSDGIRNFLSGGWENLFLTSPPNNSMWKVAVALWVRTITILIEILNTID